jgi:hypothetical protein
LSPDPNITDYSSGIGNANLVEDAYTFNYFLGFVFKGNTAPLTAMAKNIGALSIQSLQTEEVNSFDVDVVKKQQAKDDLLFQKLAEFIDNSGVGNYKTKRAAGQSGIAALNSAFQKGIFFSEVKMNWSPEFKTFYSVGPVQLSNILKTDVNKSVKGYIEIKKSISGDVISIYLEPVYGNWYFIKYENNRLAYAASSGDVSTAISSKTKGEMPDRSKFFVVQAEAMEVNQFKASFMENYGIQDDQIQEPAFDQDIQTDSLPMDSVSVEKRKQIQLNDSDNTKKRMDETNPEGYKDDASNPDQYKLKEQDTNYDENGNPIKANNKSTIEEQQQKQRDQEQLKNLFK